MRSPLANTRQAQYILLRARAYLQQVVHQTTHSLARFFLEIDANYKQFKTASRLRAAAAQRLDAQRAYYEEGRITIDRFLDAVSQYATAVATEAQYKTTYNISIVALEEAKGTLLAYDNIAVAEGPHPRQGLHPGPRHPGCPSPVPHRTRRPADSRAAGRPAQSRPRRQQPAARRRCPEGPLPLPGPAGPLGPRPTPLPPYSPAGCCRSCRRANAGTRQRPARLRPPRHRPRRPDVQLTGGARQARLVRPISDLAHRPDASPAWADAPSPTRSAVPRRQPGGAPAPRKAPAAGASAAAAPAPAQAASHGQPVQPHHAASRRSSPVARVDRPAATRRQADAVSACVKNVKTLLTISTSPITTMRGDRRVRALSTMRSRVTESIALAPTVDLDGDGNHGGRLSRSDAASGDTRRAFLKSAAAAGGAAALASASSAWAAPARSQASRPPARHPRQDRTESARPRHGNELGRSRPASSRPHSSPASATSTPPKTTKAATAEQTLGEVLERTKMRKDVYLVTKNSRAKVGGPQAFAAYEKRLNASLERLRTDYVDCYYLHGVAGREIASASAIPTSRRRSRS